jgi:hypothetical protein
MHSFALKAFAKRTEEEYTRDPFEDKAKRKGAKTKREFLRTRAKKGQPRENRQTVRQDFRKARKRAQ